MFFDDYYDDDLVFCKGRYVNTHEPCNNTDVDAYGYCKYHSPYAPQCRGTTITGNRCRIRWDLNHNQLCENHADQVQELHQHETTAEESANSTSDAKPADIKAEGCPDDEDAYDTSTDTKIESSQENEEVDQPKTKDVRMTTIELLGPKPAEGSMLLNPQATKRPRWGAPLQCRGVASTTGQRCRIKWDLDHLQLCEFHRRQVVKCHGIDETKNVRCGSTKDVDKYGFCPRHKIETNAWEDYDDGMAYYSEDDMEPDWETMDPDWEDDLDPDWEEEPDDGSVQEEEEEEDADTVKVDLGNQFSDVPEDYTDEEWETDLSDA